MSKLNLNVGISSYSDGNPTNNPQLSHFKWQRNASGLLVSEPRSFETQVGPGQTSSLYSGSYALSSNNTTEFDLLLKAGTASTYQIVYKTGPAPQFRTKRSLASDATTEISITKNANLAIVTSTGGTSPDFIVSGVQVGDKVKLGSEFNSSNQGTFSILSVTASSLTFVNENAVPETSIVLGSGFEDELRIFSAAGVQIGDKIEISGGFSPASFGTYEITGVQDNIVELYSTTALPVESDISNVQISIYTSAKRLIYVEATKKCTLNINGSQQVDINPIPDLGYGMALITADIYSLSVTNDSLSDTTKVYMASVE